MSETPSRNDPAGPKPATVPDPGPRRGRRKHRLVRIAAIAITSVVALVAVAAVGTYALVNHVASSIPRVHVGHLAAAQAGESSAKSGETVLITGSSFGPTGSSASEPSPPGFSGLIMLLHINANRKAGGAVSIPPRTVVRVPGVGKTQLWYAAEHGGPSLLVEAVERLTHVPIKHFARVSLNRLGNLVTAINGVTVQLPETTTSFGHTFGAGTNHLDGLTSIYYARQPSLSERGRVLRQQSLIRAILRKIARQGLLTSPATTARVVHAITHVLTVDSNFTTPEIVSLARALGGLSSRSATFVTAPVHKVSGQQVLRTKVSDQLWTAINHDSLADFAKRFPWTVTPEAVP
jgi:LCP family protein required for cell wall assembly